MRELRPVHFDIDAQTPEELAYANELRGQARTMIGIAQAMNAPGVTVNGLTRTLGDGEATIAVTSFVDAFENTNFTAKIRVRLKQGERLDHDEAAHFPYLWVGRRTLQVDTGPCDTRANCTSYLMVWEPTAADGSGGQVASNYFSTYDGRDYPLWQLRHNKNTGTVGDRYLLEQYVTPFAAAASVGQDKSWITDHGLVARDSAYYLAHGFVGDGSGTRCVPDREDATQWWDEEVWCDPADGEALNLGAVAWQRPFSAERDTTDRFLGTISSQREDYPDGAAPQRVQGEFLPGDYLVRVLRSGDPCQKFTPTIEEVKVVCGKLRNRTIDTFQLTIDGQMDYRQWTTPYGWAGAPWTILWKKIRGGPCLDGWNQFSSVISASPWGGSRIVRGSTPGVQAGKVDFPCSAKLVLYGAESYGSAWSTIDVQTPPQCTPTVLCSPVWDWWRGWWMCSTDADVSARHASAQASAAALAPKDCLGNPSYHEAAWGYTTPSVVMVPVWGWDPSVSLSNTAWTKMTWPLAGVSLIPSGTDEHSSYPLYDAGWQLYPPAPDCCPGPTTPLDDYTYVSVLIGYAYAVPPRVIGGTSGFGAYNDYLWDPETNTVQFLNSTELFSDSNIPAIREAAVAMGAQILNRTGGFYEYYNPDTGQWGSSFTAIAA